MSRYNPILVNTFTGGCDGEDARWSRWADLVWTHIDARPSLSSCDGSIAGLSRRELQSLAWDAYCERVEPLRFVRSLSMSASRG